MNDESIGPTSSISHKVTVTPQQRSGLNISAQQKSGRNITTQQRSGRNIASSSRKTGKTTYNRTRPKSDVKLVPVFSQPLIGKLILRNFKIMEMIRPANETSLVVLIEFNIPNNTKTAVKNVLDRLSKPSGDNNIGYTCSSYELLCLIYSEYTNIDEKTIKVKLQIATNFDKVRLPILIESYIKNNNIDVIIQRNLIVGNVVTNGPKFSVPIYNADAKNMANLREIILTSIPTMAPYGISIYENKTEFTDEQLSHFISQIVFDSENIVDEVEYDLDVVNKQCNTIMTVTSRNITTSQNTTVVPVEYDVADNKGGYVKSPQLIVKTILLCMSKEELINKYGQMLVQEYPSKLVNKYPLILLQEYPVDLIYIYLREVVDQNHFLSYLADELPEIISDKLPNIIAEHPINIIPTNVPELVDKYPIEILKEYPQSIILKYSLYLLQNYPIDLSSERSIKVKFLVKPGTQRIDARWGCATNISFEEADNGFNLTGIIRGNLSAETIIDRMINEANKSENILLTKS